MRMATSDHVPNVMYNSLDVLDVTGHDQIYYALSMRARMFIGSSRTSDVGFPVLRNFLFNPSCFL